MIAVLLIWLIGHVVTYMAVMEQIEEEMGFFAQNVVRLLVLVFTLLTWPFVLGVIVGRIARRVKK